MAKNNVIGTRGKASRIKTSVGKSAAKLIDTAEGQVQQKGQTQRHAQVKAKQIVQVVQRAQAQQRQAAEEEYHHTKHNSSRQRQQEELLDEEDERSPLKASHYRD